MSRYGEHESDGAERCLGCGANLYDLMLRDREQCPDHRTIPEPDSPASDERNPDA